MIRLSPEAIASLTPYGYGRLRRVIFAQAGFADPGDHHQVLCPSGLYRREPTRDSIEPTRDLTGR